MPLELTNLRTVMTAARLGSFSRAAEALNLTQPALSRRIAEVEVGARHQPVRASAAGVQPTDACLAFLRHAEIAFNSIENGCEAAREVESRRLSDITFGVLENLCDETLSAACRRTLSEVAGAVINFRPKILSVEITADLLSGATKLGLRYERDPDPQLETMWIGDDPIVVACASSHPLARLGKATMDDLECGRWIGSSPNIDEMTPELQDDLPSAVYSGWSAMRTVPFFARLSSWRADSALRFFGAPPFANKSTGDRSSNWRRHCRCRFRCSWSGDAAPT